MRPEVMRFAEAMERKLLENDYKGGWQDMGRDELFERVLDELEELKVAIWKDKDFLDEGCCQLLNDDV